MPIGILSHWRYVLASLASAVNFSTNETLQMYIIAMIYGCLTIFRFSKAVHNNALRYDTYHSVDGSSFAFSTAP